MCEEEAGPSGLRGRTAASPRTSDKDRSRSAESVKPAAPGSPEAMETEAFRSSLKRNQDPVKPFKAGPRSAHLRHSSTSEDSGSASRTDWGQARTPVLAKRVLKLTRTPTPSVASDTADVMEAGDVDVSDDEEQSSLSDSSAKRLKGEPRRGRGRPETTGAYRVKKAEEEKAIRKEISDLEDVLDPEVDPKTLRAGKRPDKETEELIEQMAVTPTPDLAAILYEKIQEVQKVAERSRNLKGTYVKLINNATASMHAATRELSVRAQLGQSEQAEEEMATLRRETATLRRENKHLQNEMETIRRRLLELESVPISTRATGGVKEGILSPPAAGHSGAEHRVGSSPMETRHCGEAVRRKDTEHSWDHPTEMMDADEVAVFRPPLRGSRKRLDTKIISGGATEGSRETPEYKRISEMISELIDIRARLETRAVSGGGTSSVAPQQSQAQARSSRATAGSGGIGTDGAAGKKKKKKNRKDQASHRPSEETRIVTAGNLSSGGRNDQRAGRRDTPLQPQIKERRGSTARLPPQQPPSETWATVARGKRGAGGSSASGVARRSQRESRGRRQYGPPGQCWLWRTSTAGICRTRGQEGAQDGCGEYPVHYSWTI